MIDTKAFFATSVVRNSVQAGTNLVWIVDGHRQVA